MNEGKICISVCADTVSEFTAKLGRAVEQADFIEARFDCLTRDEFDPLNRGSADAVFGRIFGHESETPFITTFRPSDQGGRREPSESEREHFWNSACRSAIVDLEEDIANHTWSWRWEKRICSYHDFDGIPDDLDAIFDRLVNTGAEIVKLAVSVDDATDAVPVWHLIERAKSRGKEIVPIAMGEAGKWTRILGLAYGAPIVYAALEEQGGTAPGQISARDLKDVFRVKELDRESAVYGVIAGDTTYSLSPYMHNAAFRASGLNSVFLPLQVRSLDAFVRRVVNSETREVELNFHGFSITNPHKRSIMDYLDEIDPTAKKIGAINTVNIENGKLHGFNTDAEGFIGPLKRRLGDLKGSSAIVAGAGGAARACVAALQLAGADVTVMARDPKKLDALAEEFGVQAQSLNNRVTADVLINATPMGTRGETEDQTLMTAEELGDVALVYDLVYNPQETRLIREAKAAGIATLGGIEMLIAQGARQFEIWTGKRAPVEVMEEAVRRRLA